MHPSPEPMPARTAIPVRFQQQRERVLRILAKWERSLAAAGRPEHLARAA